MTAITQRRLPFRTASFLVTSLLVSSSSQAPFIAVNKAEPDDAADRDAAQAKYVGMWMTDDGYVRHQLLPGGRYDEARGERESAYQGSYVLQGDHIDYVDDTGFSADGEFRDGVLYHAGMVLYREGTGPSTI